MALHILNCSIDAPDSQPDYIAEDLSYNDIESVSELILEQFLGFGNVIAEHEEHDSEEGYSFEFNKLFLFYQTSQIKVQFSHIRIIEKNISISKYYNISYLQFHPEIASPPPQV
jgi:hypothetical protein